MAKSNRTNRVRRTQRNAAAPSSTAHEDAAVPGEETASPEAGAQDAPVDEAPEQASGAGEENAVETAAADAEDSAEGEDPDAGSSAADGDSAGGSASAGDAEKSGNPRADSPQKAEKPGKAEKDSGSGKKGTRSGNPAKRSAARASGRKTSSYTSAAGAQTIKPNGRWFLPTLIAVLLLGLAWLVVFYVSNGTYPIEAWGYWNLGVGFAILVVGLMMSTRWR